MIVKSDSLGSCSGPWSLSGRSSRPSASVISEISVEHVPVPLSLELGIQCQVILVNYYVKRVINVGQTTIVENGKSKNKLN
jgi:hypothetical protein